MKQTHYLFAYIVLLLVSCQKANEEKEIFSSPPIPVTDLSSVHIPVSRVSFFANVSKYNLEKASAETRAEEETVTLESLLDQSAASEREFEGKTFRQVPFYQNEDDLLASVSDDAESDFASATVMKKFYVAITDGESTVEHVVTMVTEYQFAKFHPDFDYLHKANYSGAIIFSSLEGEVLEARSYQGGQAGEAFLLTKEEMESGEYESLRYIKWYKESPTTRSATATEMDGGELEGAVCTGERKKKRTIDDDPWDLDDVIPNDPSGGGGGSGSGTSGSGSGSGNKGRYVVPLIEYTVKLSTNLPQYITMIGSGCYEEGTATHIGFSYNYLVSEIPFTRWTGDFQNRSESSFMHLVTNNVVSTACFDYPSPCRNKQRKMTNPVQEMSVAATSGSNYYGGTFGKTRSGGTKRHTGIDLAAKPGTSLFAMYSGTVHFVKSDAPDRYLKDSYGNELVIKCSINGQYYYIQYAHLQAGTPIAINPRTNQPFKEGDEVFDGDLIAYSGKSGNAFNVENKHLHLGIGTDWQTDHRKTNWIDPLPFLNGTIDVNEEQQTSTEYFFNIICD